MKKSYTNLIFVLIALISFNSCLDGNDEEYEDYLKKQEEYKKQIYEQYQADSILITDYLAENDSLAIFHEESGLYYNVLEAGTDIRPDVNSIVAVKYKGMLLDGTVFNETLNDETVSFNLANLISGWQIGIPLIGAGGKIILYLPSYYGYGTSESAAIPANSVLIFDIDLVSFY